MEQPNIVFVTAAAKVFLEQHPFYILNKHNAAIMAREITRLFEQEQYDPSSVETYAKAFQNCLEELELREPEARKTVEDMSPEELLALPPKEQERLPDRILKKMANYELSQRRHKPTPSEESALLTTLFEEQGFSFSPGNAAIVGDWMKARNLGYSESNLRLAISACEVSLDPSEQRLNDMSSDEYLDAVVKPEFARKQAAQPKRESAKPWGVSTVQWIHSR